MQMTVVNEKINDSSEGGKGSKGLPSISNIYNQFQPLIKLYGESYNMVKRAVFYSTIGSVICRNKIDCEGIKEDTRINLFIPLKSGYGKREIKDVIKNSIEQVGLNYCEPTSLHPEQLIGKTVVGRNSKRSINKGHLADDYLVFEEATELFTRERYQEARDYIKIALDPIGQNEVYKRSVDTFKNNAVRYSPSCTITFFFQPLSIDKRLVTRGLLRRGIILFTDVNKGERYEALDRSFKEEDTSENWNQWISFLRQLEAKTFSWRVTDEAKNKIKELSKKLIRQGYDKGNKAGAYTDIMFFNLRNFLLKMSCIHAAIEMRDSVTEDDVEKAFRDLSLFWEMQLNFVMQKVKGDMDYLDLSSKEKSCLFILWDKNRLSEETSNLMIKQYIELAAEKLDCSEESAKHYYYGLKESGFIDSKQVGRYNSKVWLTDTGRKKTERYATLTTLPTLNEKTSIFQKLKKKFK